MELGSFLFTILQLLLTSATGGQYHEPLTTCSSTSSLHLTYEHRNSNSMKPRLTGIAPEENAIEKTCQINNTFADCSSCNLTFVPSYLNSNITALDLSRNKIEHLGRALVKYYNLKYLNISRNYLHVLSDENFSNLSKLLYLNFERNNLTMNGAFPQFVFMPLLSLKTLKINYNNKGLNLAQLVYPDKALSVLQNLTNLQMDGLLNKSLGPGFKKMKALKRLTLTGPQNEQCVPVIVKNETFKNVAHLEFLNLTGCCIIGRLMETGVFDPLASLQVLDISRNEQQCLEDLLPVLRSLHKSNITYLGMAGVINPYAPCVFVSREFVDTLPPFLTTLVMSSNSLEMIESDVMENLPEYLTHLDISDNRFTFGEYLVNLTKLEKLKILELNGGTLSFNLPTNFPSINSSCKTSCRPLFKRIGDTHPVGSKALLKIPPNLETVSIKFAGWSYSLTEFTIDSNNSLTKLSLRGNNIPKLIGPITGFIALKDLDLTQCSIYFIDDYFFDSFPSLTRLNLSSNFFEIHPLSVGSRSLFQSLGNLTHLDLSFTNLLIISKSAFEGLVNLEELLLHNNAFYYFDVHIMHMKNLQFIDFHFTELATLKTYTIEALNDIFKNNNNLRIDFSETPIHCFCENLVFIQWVVRSGIIPKTLTNYKCVFLDTSEKYMHDFEGVYRVLLKKCETKVEILIIISVGTALLISVIVGSIVYRFRWKLRYLYYSAYVSFKLKEKGTGTREEFNYDVFISYVSDDQHFVLETLVPQLKCRGLKTHVHAFDFIAGEHIASNIINAIQNSRHTLVVLTRCLLKSVWCKYELQMANMENVHTGRSVLVFLLMETMTKKELGTELLYHIQSSTYIRYPETDQYQNDQLIEIFWTKLVADLRS